MSKRKKKSTRKSVRRGKLSKKELLQLRRRRAALEGWRTRRANRRKKVKRPRRKPSSKRVLASIPHFPGRAPPGMHHFVEERYFSRGNQLLGFMEGRPGVISILDTTTFRGADTFDVRRVPDDVKYRISQLEMVRENSPQPLVRQTARIASAQHNIEQAWMEAERGGVLLELEVDYEDAE